ncbi:MAG: hypothetical protein ABH865_02775, partial [Candidatus Omnitrophota bacterium]
SSNKPLSQVLSARGSVCRTAEFLFDDCGIADELLLKTEYFLGVDTSCGEDAGAGGAAARRQPQAEPNTH